MTKRSTYLVILCLAVIALGGQAAGGSRDSKVKFNPPEWLLGEWSNVAESNADLIENFVFSKNDIQFTRGHLYHDKLQFSRAFKKHELKETIEPDLYRVRLSAGGDVQVYEFKRCRDEKCPSTGQDIMTYSLTKNDKIVREHSTSLTSVLFKRTRLK
ncbi:MAG TPA: hypothetical protein VFZ40_02905 [Pyrinomonadaceae bacterium]